MSCIGLDNLIFQNNYRFLFANLSYWQCSSKRCYIYFTKHIGPLKKRQKFWHWTKIYKSIFFCDFVLCWHRLEFHALIYWVKKTSNNLVVFVANRIVRNCVRIRISIRTSWLQVRNCIRIRIGIHSLWLSLCSQLPVSTLV